MRKSSLHIASFGIFVFIETYTLNVKYSRVVIEREEGIKAVLASMVRRLGAFGVQVAFELCESRLTRCALARARPSQEEHHAKT